MIKENEEMAEISCDLETKKTRIFTIHNYVRFYNKREKDLILPKDLFKKHIDKNVDFVTFYYDGLLGIEAYIDGDRWRYQLAGNQNAYQLLKSYPSFWTNILIELNKILLNNRYGVKK